MDYTIRWEIICYLIVPLIAVNGLLRKRFLLLITLIVMASAQALDIRFQKLPNWFVIFGGSLDRWPFFLTPFLCGMCFYLFRKNIVCSGKVALGSLALFTFVTLFPSPKGLFLFFQPFLLTYLIFYIAFNSKIPLSGFGKLGDFSYGTYLYAWPIMQLLIEKFPEPLSPIRLFFTATPITLLFAVASWHLVEKRFLEKKHVDVSLHERPA